MTVTSVSTGLDDNKSINNTPDLQVSRGLIGHSACQKFFIFFLFFEK